MWQRHKAQEWVEHQGCHQALSDPYYRREFVPGTINLFKSPWVGRLWVKRGGETTISAVSLNAYGVMLSNYPLNMHTVVRSQPESQSVSLQQQSMERLTAGGSTENEWVPGPKWGSCTSPHPMLSQSSGSIQGKGTGRLEEPEKKARVWSDLRSTRTDRNGGYLHRTCTPVPWRGDTEDSHPSWGTVSRYQPLESDEPW